MNSRLKNQTNTFFTNSKLFSSNSKVFYSSLCVLLNHYLRFTQINRISVEQIPSQSSLNVFFAFSSPQHNHRKHRKETLFLLAPFLPLIVLVFITNAFCYCFVFPLFSCTFPFGFNAHSLCNYVAMQSKRKLAVIIYMYIYWRCVLLHNYFALDGRHTENTKKKLFFDNSIIRLQRFIDCDQIHRKTGAF